MCAGYDLVIIVDAISRDDVAGTVLLVEAEECAARGVPDAHAMDVGAVLALFDSMAATLECKRPRILVAGCVPAATHEGMELSDAVRNAIPECRKLLRTLTGDVIATGART
jgi:hydrogenase maturation protease